MKNQTRTPLILGSVALALTLFTGSPVLAQSTGTPHDKMQMDDKKPAMDHKAMDHKMMAQCEDMKKQKQAMKDDMKAQDAELTSHVARMNAAASDKKAGVTAEVVTHMLEQRIAMDARKAKMDEAMMQHMMEHMQMDKDSMAMCPMMKMKK